MTLPKPYYSRDGVTIHVGDVRDVLAGLQEQSVHCVVTSPPYWGLRDYGVAGQIGQEKTPEEYVATMVEVFRGVRRVLHDSGTVWLNVGDSYASTTQSNRNGKGSSGLRGGNVSPEEPWNAGTHKTTSRDLPDDIKPKDLCLIPFRLAIALQADGWYVRSVIVWAKKSCMPESVTDRPTNSWEPIFLLSKRAKYFYDAEAVKEPTAYPVDDDRAPSGGYSNGSGRNDAGQHRSGGFVSSSTRNQRNVWHLGPEPYAEAHFATFPSEIPRRAILAGTSEEGCCPQCGEMWVRVVEKIAVPRREKRIGYDYGTDPDSTTNNGRRPNGKDVEKHRAENPTKTIGWQPGCKCNAGKPIPCTVADIFFGSGTTGVVAQELHVNCIGIELNPAYAELTRDRFRQGVLNFGGEE